jgi:UDP-N-acetylglucosamine--dolichyl-phosphate N-acetylglucosaminephosphotransferase
MYSKVYQEKLVFMHCAAVLSISMAILLGFVDDVIDIAWRYKIWIPMFASLPVLVAYSGVTYVVVPIPLRSFLGDIVDLNYLYYIYMTMLSIFCTNSINIYAGINGIEVGQSLVIGCCILLYNVIEISLAHVAGKFETIQLHMLSIIIIVPYLCVTKALFKFNAYPSQVFVGDTFCYFSGMVFAVVGILGHFSKTLLLFFIPQIINFVYSIPQLL